MLTKTKQPELYRYWTQRDRTASIRLLRLVGEGHVYVKLSAPYRLSDRFPDYPDARPFHEALLRANPQPLMWGTDWPHPSIPGEIMPDDVHLLDLLCQWTPDEQVRRCILVDTPARLFGS